MCILGVGLSNITRPQYTKSVEIKPSIGANITGQVTGRLPNLPVELNSFWLGSKWSHALLPDREQVN